MTSGTTVTLWEVVREVLPKATKAAIEKVPVSFPTTVKVSPDLSNTAEAYDLETE